MATDAADAVHAAVAGGTLTGDTARAILRCIDADGCIDAPNDLLAGIAREVIEAAGVEFRLTKGANLPATPRGKRSEQDPKRRRQTVDRPQKAAVPASSQGSQRPQKRRKRRDRPQPPSQPVPRPAPATGRLRRPLPSPRGSLQRRDRVPRPPGPPRIPPPRLGSSAPIPQPCLP